MAETIWLYDVQGGYHDHRCPCVHHCGYCFDNLTNPRRRYCGDYCRYLAKKERAFDRAFLAALNDHAANCGGCDLHQEG